MIHLARPLTAPAVLLTRGVAEARRLCDEYDRDGRIFESRDFRGSIYAHATVKTALRSAQQDKCAFCESFFTRTGYGDVEHYRPKAGYKQAAADDLKRPGYFWLAYEWDNLFFACQLCNQQFKQNLFPLRNNRARARPGVRDISREKPLLVDPARLDPTRFVGFRNEVAFPVGGRREGVVTIDVFGLNRPELVEARRRRLRVLTFLVRTRDRARVRAAADPAPELAEELREVEEMLDASREPASEYSAMARAFLDGWAAR